MTENLFLLLVFMAGWLLLLAASSALVAALSWLGARLTGEKSWQDWAARVMERGRPW